MTPPTRRDVLRLGAAVPVAALARPAATAATTTVDVCVYGATVAGIAAAVQVRRMGGTAVVLEPTSHVGGMTTGGLSRADIGTSATVGGLAREFFRRIAARNDGGTADPQTLATGPMLTSYAPHVAAAVVDDLLTAAGVTVLTGATLASVSRSAGGLATVTAAGGTTVRATVFVDASYEGDLMAMAGVAWTVGREANSRYGESNDGVQVGTMNQFTVPVDPYRTPGDPASGLLPEVSGAALAATGSGDAHVQAYCYRLCLTRASGRLPFPRPAGYDAGRYALATRLIAAGWADGFDDKAKAFFGTAALPGGLADANNAGPFSFDRVGGADAYPTASWTARAAIAADHRTYQQGLLYFLANDPGVRADVRAAVNAFGLAPGEFTDTAHWPAQLYVREARRLVTSYYVVTEADCRGQTVAADGVCLASYQRDSHNCQRLVVAGSGGPAVRNEGDLQIPLPAPFPVSYRAMVPEAAQCTNLLVPVCLSASHLAYGSLRMEPVYLMLGQAAGTAAKLAVDAGVRVQDVGTSALRARLFQDGAVLAVPDVTVDNRDAAVTGTWTASSATPGYLGADYLQDGNAGKGAKSVRFAPSLAAAGSYRVYLRWTSAAGRASNVPVTVAYQGGSATLAVDQRTGGGTWALLGTWPFAAGTAGTVTVATTGTDGYVIADAVRLVRAG